MTLLFTGGQAVHSQGHHLFPATRTARELLHVYESQRTGILLLEVSFLGFFLQIPTLQRDQEEEVTKDTKNEGEEGECVVG